MDGTILPGVTRTSVLDLCARFNTQESLRQFVASPALISSGDQKIHSKEEVIQSLKSLPPSTTSSPSSTAPALPPTEVPASQEPTTWNDGLPRLHAREATLKLTDLERLNASGALRECFGSGTAAVICPISRIGVLRRRAATEGSEAATGTIEDIVLPEFEGGMGPVGGAMYRALVAVYEGRVDVDGWSVAC